jgi:protein SCO1/2
MTRLGLLAALAVSVLTVCVSAQQQGQQKRQREYEVTGMVMKVDRDRATFVVSHDSIPELMGAMMMPFTVQDAKALDGLTPGVNVTFTLVVGAESAYATDVRVRRYESVEQDPLTARRLALLKRLSDPAAQAGQSSLPGQPPAIRQAVAVGQVVPDFTLIDQRHRRVNLSRLKGKVVAVSFVYTSCALPQFCLRTASNFAVLQKRFRSVLGRDLVLLTVTFDPAHDRPDVLARYAAQWDADPATWHFLTGSVQDVRRVTNLFGLDFFPDEGLLDHSVRTAFIDRAGRLAANIEGNQFSANQLGDLIQTLVAH